MELTTQHAAELYRTGQVEQALAVLDAVLAATPQDWMARNTRGVVLCRLGRASEAVPAFTRLLAVDPAFAEGWFNLALARRAVGETSAAAGGLLRAVALRPAEPVFSAEAGALLHSQGVLTEALRHLRRVILLQPDQAPGYLNVAVSLMSDARYDEAVAALRRGRRLAPDHGDLALRLGQALLSQGRAAEACTVLDPLAQRVPGHGEISQNLERARLVCDVAAAVGHAALPDGLAVRGPFSVLSGYGDLAQRFVSQMAQQGTRLRLLGLTGAEAWRPAEGGVETPIRPSAALSFLTPLLVEPVSGVPTVNYTMFEGTSIPASWARANAAHDLVVVPTESSRRAWIEAGHPADRLRVCPPGIQPHPGDEAEAPRTVLGPGGRPVADFRVRILNISDFIARKNIDGLLRVWLRATRAGDDAILLLKLGKGGPTLNQDFSRLLDETARHVGRRFEEAAPIMALMGRYDEAGISTLYALATHYWSLSHGEGWDLPITRAGAKGLGLIAPRNSAYTAYLDDSIAHLIPCTTGPAHMPYSRAIYPPFQGIDWWHPDEDVAAELLTRLVRGQLDRRDPRAQLLDRFAWQKRTQDLLAVVEEVGRGR
ncbi:tetratricopeptide repeat protein (plasmid) [Azospirillum sp. TSA2s]|uniref:tetratricopeptide repeat-containing glycosyltransferase family protein n=1 Tax=Azospirillum sp. TSA2s TaxID=709810 RepID=UPI0010AAF118|nr:tetratricopeptide repeat protein [Azospirillum sp. TSA2s]QCG93005.1 tetratricopeptide repeat protein [Azospirillum sp. TSA2s]